MKMLAMSMFGMMRQMGGLSRTEFYWYDRKGGKAEGGDGEGDAEAEEAVA